MKHLLKLRDLSREDILSLLNFADQLKFERKNGIQKDYLKGKKIGLFFGKPSIQTRVSIETGIFELGGYGLFLSDEDFKIGSGESLQNVTAVLSRYLDGIVVRTADQQEIETMAKSEMISVINGLSDEAHPCLSLAALMTVREFKGSLKGLKIAYVGDGNSSANSIIVGAEKLGCSVTASCPKGYSPDKKILDWAKENGDFNYTLKASEAVADADVVITDACYISGKEKEKKDRLKAFKDYQINGDLLKNAKQDVLVLHCHPVQCGDEITREVFEEHAKEIFDQAENYLHIQKSVMVKLLK